MDKEIKKRHSPLACLNKAELFKNLPLDVLKKLVPISTHQQYFPKGSLIRQPFDGQAGILVIDEGSAKVYNLNEEGKETVLGLLQKGDYDGQQSLFSRDTDENFIQALQDTWVCSINRRDFQKLLQETPNLALTMLNSFGEKLVTVQRNTVRRNSLDAQGRLLAFIKDLEQEQGSQTVTLKMKKKDIASYLGITPETLSRQLKLLVKEGKITVQGKQIKIK